jgi:thiamine biosynthesis lipoprotein
MQTSEEQRLHSIDFKAMGCTFSVWLSSPDRTSAQLALNSAYAFVNAAEEVLSRFRPESELSRLNARSGVRTRVSPLLWEAISAAFDAAEATGGIYDPTVLNSLVRAGYDSSFNGLRTSAGVKSPIASVHCSWKDVNLDHETKAVTLPPGAGLDLGGIGKAWVADRAADILEKLGPCLVDAGGDIATRGSPEGNTGWLVGVMDPFRPDTDLVNLEITGRGVATSGVDYRRWVKDGKEQHHIIDTRTGLPAHTDLVSVTVIGPDASQADAIALSLVVLGSQQGTEFIGRFEGFEAMLVPARGRPAMTPAFNKYLAAA